MRLVVLSLAAAAAAPASGFAESLPVYVVRGAPVAGVDTISAHAAVGLVVPDAGPTTSEARARASLVRGKVVNSLHGKLPSGPRLIEYAIADGIPVQLRRGIVVAIPKGGEQPNDRRYPVALVGSGRGLLTSTSTRIPGLISIADVAHPERLGIQPDDDPAGYVQDLDQRIRDNGRSRIIAAILATIVIAALAFAFPGAAVVAFATVAAVNLLLGIAGVSEPWLAVTLLVLAAAAAAPLAFALRSALAVALALAGVIAAYLVAMGADATWVALSPLGPSQNGRFYGVSNLLETMLLVPALAAAALLFRRYGWLGFVAVAGLAVVTVASSRFGADGGGALVLAAGYAVLGVAYAGRGRRALVVAGGAAAAVVAIVAVDALLGPATHLGEAVRGGPGEVAGDVADRLALSWRRATENVVVGVVVAGSIVTLAALVARGRRRALPLAFAAAIAVSLLVNDSPREVALGGLVGYLALARYDDGDGEGAVYTLTQLFKELTRDETQGLRS